MKKLLLILFLIITPIFAYADIAGPVLTKDQACTEKDGASRNRLQIFLNGKKSDTLYFYKKNTTLYYIVPMFPYVQKEYDQYGYSQGLNHYYAALFLYQYDCKNEKSFRISDNLKKGINTIWGPINGEEKISSRILREMSYGEIQEITQSGIVLTLGIPQTGISSNSITIRLKN